MVSDLNRLASLIQEDSIPDWLRKKIEQKETLDTLERDGVVTLSGPGGEVVEIRKSHNGSRLAKVKAQSSSA